MMRALPYVSVIIPTYNRAKMLPITLDSFLNQDYPRDRYEIIVANNNSRCGLEEVRRVCGDLALVVPAPAQGAAAARNAAIDASRGPYLAFTDFTEGTESLHLIGGYLKQVPRSWSDL